MAESFGLKLGIDGEKEFKDSIKEINGSFKVLESEMKLVTSQFDKNESSVESLSAKNEVLTKQIDLQKNKVSELHKTVGVLTENYGASDKRTQEWAKNLNNAQAELNNLERELNDNKSAIDNFGKEVQETGTKLDDAGQKASSFGDTLKAILTADAVKAGARGLVDSIKAVGETAIEVGKFLVDTSVGTAAYADTILTISTQTGIAAEDLQAYKYAAELVDVSLETLTGSMAKQVRSMDAARDGNEKMQAAYRQLGVSVTDASGNLRDGETVYWEAIDALGQMKEGAERDALAMQIFGKSAQELNPLIAQSSAGIAELTEEARKMGAVLSSEQLAQAGDFDDTIQRLTAGSEAAKNAIGMILMPQLNELGTAGVDLLGEFTRKLNESGGDWSKISDVVGETAQNFTQMVTEQLPKFLEVGGDIVGGVLTGLLDASPDMIESAKTFIGNIADNFHNNLPQIKEKGKEIVGNVIDGVGDVGSDLITMGADFITAAVSALLDPQNLAKLVEAGKKIGNSVVEGIKGITDEIDYNLFGIFYDYGNSKGGGSYIETETDVLKQQLTKIKNLKLDISEELFNATEKLINEFNPVTATEEQRQAILTAFDKLLDEVEKKSSESLTFSFEGFETYGIKAAEAIDENSDKPPETVKQLMDRINTELALGTTDVEGAIAELKDSLKNFAEGSDEWNQIQIKINVLIEQDIVQTFRNIKDEVNDMFVLEDKNISKAISRWQEYLSTLEEGSDEYRDVQVEIKKLQNDQIAAAEKAANEAKRKMKEAAAEEKKRLQEVEKAYKEAFAERKEAIEDFVFFSDMTTKESIEYQIAEYKKLAEEYANDVEFMKDIRKKQRDLEKQLIKEEERIAKEAADAAKKAAEEAAKAAEEAAEAAAKAEEERLKAIKEAFDKEKEVISDFVYFSDMTTAESIEYQITEYEKLAKEYKDNAEFMEDINKKLFDLRKQQDKELTNEFISDLDYQLKFTQMNEEEKLRYKMAAITAEIEARKAAGIEYADLEEQYTKYSKDLDLEQYNSERKLLQDEYNDELELFRKKTSLKDRNYADEIKTLARLQEQYKNDAEFRIKLEQEVYDYKEALSQRLSALDSEQAQRTMQLFEQMMPDAGKFDLLKELEKIDENANNNLERSKNLNEAQGEYNKTLGKTADLQQKSKDISNRLAAANTKVSDAYENWQNLVNQPLHLNNAGTKDQIAAAEKIYNAAVKERTEAEKDLKDNAKEIESVDKDAAKNKENIIKEVEKLIEIYPELKDRIDEETGALKMTNAELDEYIENQKTIAEEAARTKPQTDLLQGSRDAVKALQEYTDGIEKIKGLDLNENYVDFLEKQGVGGLDTINAILGFTPEQLKEYMSNIDEAWNISSKMAEEEFAPEIEKTQTALNDITAMITEFAESPELAKATSDVGNNIDGGVGEGIEANAETVTTALNDAVSTAAEAAQSTALESGKPIGNNLIDGIIAGIDAMIPQLQAKMSEALSVMTGAATGFLQIASPSKLFKNLVGKNIALGIGAGIDDEMPNVIDDAQKYIKMMTGVIAQSSRLSPTENAMRGINSASIVQTQSAQKQESEEVKIVVEIAGNARDIFSAVGANIEYYRNLDGVKA